jgi:hypothetical protein
MVTGLEVAGVSEDRSVASESGQHLLNPNHQHPVCGAFEVRSMTASTAI